MRINEKMKFNKTEKEVKFVRSYYYVSTDTVRMKVQQCADRNKLL